MLALAIEFSRCPKVRTLKAEQRNDAGMHTIDPTRVRPEGLLEVWFEGWSDELASASTWSLPGCRAGNGCPCSPVCQRLLRKEVIQPHLPVRLPCYDFIPIASPTFDGSFHKG